MIILPVPSDGSCLFASLASFFKSSTITHENIRRMIVHYIYQHPTQFELDIQAEGYTNVDDYCSKMAQINYWGDGICCQAFSVMFQVNVWIFYDDGSDYTQISHFDGRPHIALLLKQEHYSRILSW